MEFFGHKLDQSPVIAYGLIMKTLFIPFFFILLLGGCEEPVGVLFSNQISETQREYIKKNKILNQTETILAYYDVTLLSDNSESAILTNERVIYHRPNKNYSFLYKDIKDVDHKTQMLVGDIIIIENFSGEHIKIEIAPLNDGELFLELLLKKIGKSK